MIAAASLVRRNPYWWLALAPQPQQDEMRSEIIAELEAELGIERQRFDGADLNLIVSEEGFCRIHRERVERLERSLVLLKGETL
ncbi:MAG: hypothetical protein ACM33U_09020 [Solirubrobacterales bacterium]|nr:hypothetical protein [Solirubrobacterales bacterium]